jgi:hypothetical protein
MNKRRRRISLGRQEMDRKKKEKKVWRRKKFFTFLWATIILASGILLYCFIPRNACDSDILYEPSALALTALGSSSFSMCVFRWLVLPKQQSKGTNLDSFEKWFFVGFVLSIGLLVFALLFDKMLLSIISTATIGIFINLLVSIIDKRISIEEKRSSK